MADLAVTLQRERQRLATTLDRLPLAVHPGRAADGLRGLRLRSTFADVERYCMFVGCGRSGHSLVGSLLDAHPEAVVAHELDALRFVAAGYRRHELLARIVRHDAQFTEGGRAWFGYDYRVPGQWQGRWSTLRVIGDKKGGQSTARLAEAPHLLEALEELVGVPVRHLHVVRHPQDNVATMAARTGESLAGAAHRYLGLCRAVADLHRRRPDQVLDIRHEDVVAHPRTSLTAIAAFVGLDAPQGWLDACASVVFPSPRRTRDRVAWPDEVLAELAAGVAELPFLAGYEVGP